MAGLSDGGMTRTFEQNRNARLVPSANRPRSEKSTRGERRSNGRASHKEQRGQNAAGVNIRFDMSIAQSRQSAPGQRLVKQRLHQASFREAVIGAYRGRGPLSGLPESMLLDAAHIVEDQHDSLGQPSVRNGIPLSKIHHAAFDARLIGIDPDYRLHVSERLLAQNDGPMLEAISAPERGITAARR
jgi:predicted restriction endonuclease